MCPSSAERIQQSLIELLILQIEASFQPRIRGTTHPFWARRQKIRPILVAQSPLYLHLRKMAP
jgi:hypothetical protein